MPTDWWGSHPLESAAFARRTPDADIWPDPSLRPTSAIAQRLVHASYCVIDTPILPTAGVIASIEACDAGVSSGPVRPARRAQRAPDRSAPVALLSQLA